jgi:hypothetical protein
LFWVAVTLLAGYVSVFVLFPRLHINHHYYQVENAILLCAAAAIVIEALWRRGRLIEGYLVLAVIVVGQLWAFYTGTYFRILTDDLRRHPYYQAGMVVRERTPPDSVVVVFGTDYGADLPYFGERRGVVLANWFPLSAVRRVLFEERDRWLGGRKLGAVVDCTVYGNQVIGPNLVPIRDALTRELAGKVIEVRGSFYGQQIDPPQCLIFLRSSVP